MDFSDETYVRLYVRDTKTWKKLKFEGQTVLMFLLRKLDRAGILDDIEDPVPDVALMTEVPEEIVEQGLPKLLETGVLRLVGSRLIMPRYIEAQTAIRSDKVRARESRSRRRAVVLLEELVELGELDASVVGMLRDGESRSVTGGHGTSAPRLPAPARESVTFRDGAVTPRDNESRDDTERHAAPGSRHSVLSCAVQSSTTEAFPKDRTGDGERARGVAAAAETGEEPKKVFSGPAAEGPPRSPVEVPCPADLALPEAAIAVFETSMVPRWAVAAITRDFVAKAVADPDDRRTLKVWRKCLAAAVSGRWSDPNKRPTQDEPAQPQRTGAKRNEEPLERVPDLSPAASWSDPEKADRAQERRAAAASSRGTSEPRAVGGFGGG